MKLKTSLFSKAVYHSTIKRCIWGSVIYAAILFLTVVMPIFSEGYYDRVRYLLLDDYLEMPLLYAVVTPTIAGAFVYRFIHSKKHAFFIHSMPATRNAIFVSSFAAGMTLLAAPIVFTSLLLLLITPVTPVFAWECLLWMLINIFALFVLFSVSTLAAMLTGNGFAYAVVNVLLHLVTIFTVGSYSAFGKVFLYGYPESSEVSDFLGRFNFVSCVIHLRPNYDYLGKHYEVYDWVTPLVVGILAILILVVSWILYKKRKIEVAENVAGFDALNPVFKYLLTFFVSCGILDIYSEAYDQSVIQFAIDLLLVSAIVYFGIEMLTKKTRKILYSVKGYVAFMALFVMVTCIFAFVPFGYETYIPPKEDIAAVALEEYYANDPQFSSNKAKIDYVMNFHKEMISPEMRYIMKNADYERNYRLSVYYKHKSGKVTSRKYYVPFDTYQNTQKEYKGTYKSE